MLKFLTSLSFLYIFVIAILLLYGFIYYKNFERSHYNQRLFPLIFLLIGMACFSFLWINFHAPLPLKTFSNLDHHFIQHDGFEVAGKIELGNADTINFAENSFSRFVFARQNGSVTVNSVYSEEPLYIHDQNRYRILSTKYPAIGHEVSFRCGGVSIAVNATEDNWFEIKAGEKTFKKEMQVKKAVSCWNIFRDEDEFINSEYYNNGELVSCLKNILFLRDDVSRKKFGELSYFLSGRLFNYARNVKYDGQKLEVDNLKFAVDLPDQSSIAWGIGFLDNNRNQYKVKYTGTDSFLLANRYPVSYPLSEENRNDWTSHRVSKFLVADPLDMREIPAVFREGFLFSPSSNNKAANFSPMVLSYQKNGKNESLQLKAWQLNNAARNVEMKSDWLVLPSKTSEFNWIFSIRNTYNWDFGNLTLSGKTWQGLIFGSLGFLFLAVFLTSLIKPVSQQSWVWQLLSCITIVLLATRFFLYWRYKTFPPYDGMDLPSQQQLQSLSNFGIILLTTILLAIVFGFYFLKQCYRTAAIAVARLLNKPYAVKQFLLNRLINSLTQRFSFVEKFSKQTWFFAGWTLLLLSCGAVAGFSDFDPGVCRHLAIVLMLGYFVFLYISYKFSPLVASTKESWWKIGTGNFFNILFNNPVKILLSVSLLALFVFIDIGFAIVFLNFLFFNEAFLCVNYGIAGLSAGSKRNATLFGAVGTGYILFFVLNLLYAPYIFKFLLNMPQSMYVVAYLLMAIAIAYLFIRLLPHYNTRRKFSVGFVATIGLFVIAFFFFPSEKIISKAAMTKYRIDVLTTPVDEAVMAAYEEGRTYEPVIRAAQNQWFINTFIYEDNNPGVQSTGFQLLPHAPQHKGAKYNAQATDLVASRFLIAEHGKGAVLLYVLLLLLPVIMFGSFYKLYPDFTNRTNTNYPVITAGFSILNYMIITALLVILAATGRYIFFGQDLPFASILSKQSILFPCILIVILVVLFKKIPQEYYANRKKIVPGSIIFLLLAVLLFFFKPAFNRNKEFAVANLAKEMDDYVRLHLQPILDYVDTSSATRRLTIAKKDEIFSDSLRKMLESGVMDNTKKFFVHEINAYARSGFSRHLDQRRMLYLDLYSGSPELAVNENYFRVEPPPHLQQLWTGNVFGDTAIYNISVWNAQDGSVMEARINRFGEEPVITINDQLQFSFENNTGDESVPESLVLINRSASALILKEDERTTTLDKHESFKLNNPCRILITDSLQKNEKVLTVQPDAFMKNYYVNGNRFYLYPMGNEFIWARNFAEAISSDYTGAGDTKKNAFVSLDFGLMDSLAAKIQHMMDSDTAYKKGAEYGICIADGNGRIIALSDFIKGFNRPDPNDKAAFNKALLGDNGFVSQSLLRKQIGNLNLLRLNPGPGSTFKPIVFSAIASQLNWNWDNFAAEGFSEKQAYYGGEKVPEYDFEKDNGTIKTVSDYLKYSDNYYHSNVLLLGSYPKQNPATILAEHFMEQKPGTGFHWPYFTYTGKQYWMNGFQNWPGYNNGKANFGLDSSFTTIGLLNNYGIYTHQADKSFDTFSSEYDSSLFVNAYRKSAFILPEYGLFDQRGDNVDHRIPDDLFISCFRGHVKGSSQVMVPPVKMVEAFGKMISQSRNYQVTLNPYAISPAFMSFDVDNSIPYNSYLSIMRENVFTGMREALFRGTAARLGSMLKDGAPYYYYAKTGTTGDEESKAKSKLFAIVISSKDITHPDFNFRNNKFYTIYFTSQNGPAKQNEEFQAEVIRFLQESLAFNRYMKAAKK